VFLLYKAVWRRKIELTSIIYNFNVEAAGLFYWSGYLEVGGIYLTAIMLTFETLEKE
jgi:hypothetical protein